jgi:DNA-binding NarL/FixJ family response regulator
MARINRRMPTVNPPEMWLDLMQKYGTDQLSIPLHVTRGRYRAYVLVDSRPDDWPAEDLEFARRLQPLLIGLERQATALARGGVPPNVLGLMDEVRLTPRELAVLRVLGSGCTVQQIAHRVGMAPRTAQKHLEHIYAKLQVSDRLSAVLKAQQLGLLQIADQNDAANCR